MSVVISKDKTRTIIAAVDERYVINHSPDNRTFDRTCKDN